MRRMVTVCVVAVVLAGVLCPRASAWRLGKLDLSLVSYSTHQDVNVVNEDGAKSFQKIGGNGDPTVFQPELADQTLGGGPADANNEPSGDGVDDMGVESPVATSDGAPDGEIPAVKRRAGGQQCSLINMMFVKAAKETGISDSSFEKTMQARLSNPITAPVGTTPTATVTSPYAEGAQTNANAAAIAELTATVRQLAANQTAFLQALSSYEPMDPAETVTGGDGGDE